MVTYWPIIFRMISYGCDIKHNDFRMMVTIMREGHVPQQTAALRASARCAIAWHTRVTPLG